MSIAARKVFTGVGLLLAAALLFAGCGGGDSSSSTSTPVTESTAKSGSSGDEGIQRAQADVKKYEAEQPVEKLPPLGEAPAKDVNVTILSCVLPACQQTTDGAIEGAKALGWKTNFVTSELTPEDYVNHFNEIVRNPPEALAFLSVFPNSTVQEQLDELHEKGVAMMQIDPQAGEKPTAGVPGVVQGPPEFFQGGKLAADKVIAEAEGDTSAAIVFDPAFGTFNATVEGWEKTFGENCPECSLGKIEISLNAPATQNIGQAVTYLRQNPDTEYVFFVIADAASGFPEALASAGLSEKVKFITMTPTPTDLKQIEGGSQLASVAIENGGTGLRSIDGLARQLQGEDVGPEHYPAGWAAIISKENVPAQLPEPPGTPERFLEAWQIK